MISNREHPHLFSFLVPPPANCRRAVRASSTMFALLGNDWLKNRADPNARQAEHRDMSQARMLLAFATSAMPVDPDDWEIVSLGTAAPNSEAAKIPECWEAADSGTIELRRLRVCEASRAKERDRGRARRLFLKGEADKAAAVRHSELRRKRAADAEAVEAEEAEERRHRQLVLARADTRAASIASMQAVIVAEDGRVELYRAELSPAEAQRAEARGPAVQAACDSATEAYIGVQRRTEVYNRRTV